MGSDINIFVTLNHWVNWGVLQCAIKTFKIKRGQVLDTHFLLLTQNHIEFFFLGNSPIAEVGSIQTLNYYIALCPSNTKLTGLGYRDM